MTPIITGATADKHSLVGLMRALAHDCENTDGWTGAAPDVHAAADLILVLEARLESLLYWATLRINAEREVDDDDWGRGWDAGYDAAASMVYSMLSRTADLARADAS